MWSWCCCQLLEVGESDVMSHGGLAPTFSPLHLTVCVTSVYWHQRPSVEGVWRLLPLRVSSWIKEGWWGQCLEFPSVLWCCWLCCRKGIWPVDKSASFIARVCLRTTRRSQINQVHLAVRLVYVESVSFCVNIIIHMTCYSEKYFKSLRKNKFSFTV